MKVISKHSECAIGTPHWYEMRKEAIGSSEAPTACGVNPFKTQYELWAEKVGLRQPENLDGKEQVLWGQLLERTIAGEFARRMNLNLNFFEATIAHEGHEFMLADLDAVEQRIVEPSRVMLRPVEIKNVGEFRKKQLVDGALEYHEIQVRHQMMVTNSDIAYLVYLVGGNKLRHFIIERDLDTEAVILELEQTFIRRVKEQDPPQMVAADEDVVKSIWESAKADLPAVILPDYASSYLQKYKELRDKIKELEDIKSACGAELKAMMQNAPKAICGEETINWANVNKHTFDSTRFKQEQPQLYGQYLKPSQYRQFRVK